MQLPFAIQGSGRASFALPAARLVNLFPEETPGGPSKVALLSRAGLVREYTIGDGPIRGLFQLDGAFGGSVFAVSGSGVYKDATLLGTISGTGRVRMAASSTQLVIVSGGAAYCYDGDLNQITDADLPAVSDVRYLAGRFYYVQSDTDKIWFSALADATSIDGLAFESAEKAPDAIVGIEVVGDELVIFGSQTVEWFYQTGDSSAPLARSPGRTYDTGCSSQASIVPFDNSVVWVTDARTVARGGAQADKISTADVDEALRKCSRISQCSAFEANFDGHKFYVLNIPGQGTWAYDAATRKWAQWDSHDRDTFRAWCSVTVGGVTYVGDDTEGKVYTLSPEARDDDGEPISRVASAFLPATAPVRCDNVMLQCVRGVGEASAELRWSDDGGRTFSDWRAASMGGEGEYSVKAVWRQMGALQSPGRLFEVRCSDAVIVAFQFLAVNEPRP